MSGFLLDTNVPSELSKPLPDKSVEAWLERADRRSTYISVISLGEIRKGIAVLGDSARRRGLEEWFASEIDAWFEDRILAVTRKVSERWGEIEGERQLQGRPLSTADGLIAATALEHDLSLVTRNSRDFEGLGVTIVSPWTG